jgi:C2 domain
MTKEEIDEECLKDTLSWIDTGSGDLGRLFFEVLKCDNLPNMDIGGFIGNKTDGFASIVFEDTIIRTDIIDDSLSPRWLPWMKRGFIFHIQHSSSDISIGLFDYDYSPNPVEEHDMIGRITVELSNLRKDTTYTLTYDMYTSAKLSNPTDIKNSASFRRKAGTMTIRLRIEVEDERKLVLSNLAIPPTVYVNTRTRKDFKVLRATCLGRKNLDNFDLNIIYS